MKKQLPALLLMGILFLSCQLETGDTGRSQISVSFSAQWQAVTSQVITGSRAMESYTGTLLVLDHDTQQTESFDWYASLNEETFEAVSRKAIGLAPGTYDFTMNLNRGSHSYIGTAVNQTLVDGQHTVNISLSPVIGAVTAGFNVNSLPEIRFSFPPGELENSTSPQIGCIIDDSTETIIDINPATGLSTAYVFLTEGPHTIVLHFYDKGLQIGRSVKTQENVIIAAGNNIHMDIVPLHAEMEFALTMEGGDAGLNFLLPPEAVTEAGGIANLEVQLSLNHPDLGLHEEVLNLMKENGRYTAVATIPAYRYGEVTMSLVFVDTANNEIIGSCTGIVALNAQTSHVSLALAIRRRIISSGNLLALLCINAFDVDNNPAAGAAVYANGELIGLTGGGGFGPAGYLKVYPVTGSYTIEAKVPGAAGSGQVDLTPLEVKNTDIHVNTAQVQVTIVVPERGSVELYPDNIVLGEGTHEFTCNSGTSVKLTAHDTETNLDVKKFITGLPNHVCGIFENWTCNGTVSSGPEFNITLEEPAVITAAYSYCAPTRNDFYDYDTAALQMWQLFEFYPDGKARKVEQYMTDTGFANSETLTYNENDLLTRIDYVNSPQGFSHAIFEYLDNSTVIDYIVYYKEALIDIVKEFTYDINDLLTRVDIRDGSNNSAGYELFFYDEQSIVRTENYNPDNTLNSYTVYAYNTEGQCAEANTYDSSDILTSFIRISYDAEGYMGDWKLSNYIPFEYHFIMKSTITDFPLAE